MTTFELLPTDSRKSFYNKCRVNEENGIKTLVSYTTNVATFNVKTQKLRIDNIQSPTTRRHINSFLHHCGLESMSKKEMENHIKEQ